MNEFFRVYNDSVILNRVLEFPITLAWTETGILRILSTPISCKMPLRRLLSTLQVWDR